MIIIVNIIIIIIKFSPTLRCVLQFRISFPQWVVFNGVKGQTNVIVQSDSSISIKGSLLLGERYSTDI